jgi:predicted O-methyltransferase YrrM
MAGEPMMFDSTPPAAWPALVERTAQVGFGMPSDAASGALLRMLAASKPGGRLLELGTGTGLATAWLLDGMDAGARLISIDNDAAVQGEARAVLGKDSRVAFIAGDGLAYIREQSPASFDLVFADAWPGKYEGLDEALALLAPGGLYIGDDMLPQPNWPPGHQARVDGLLAQLAADGRLAVQALDWGTGFVIAARRAD